jgi:hypothetical protein
LLPKLEIIWLSNISILGVPDEGYSRKSSYALNLISTMWRNKNAIHYRDIFKIDITATISLPRQNTIHYRDNLSLHYRDISNSTSSVSQLHTCQIIIDIMYVPVAPCSPRGGGSRIVSRIYN